MNKYWRQALYNKFYNINKTTDCNKFFYYLKTIIRYYKNTQMLVTLSALNNIIAHRLLNIYCEVLSDSYYYQMTNNFEKLLEQEDKENTIKIKTPIFVVIKMHIKLTSFLKNSTLSAK